ncbi:hypothetical protein D9M72_469890 [compost metagenome]
MGVADGLARLGAEVGEGDGSVTVTEGDGAGLLDLLQGTGQLGGEGRSGNQGCCDSGGQNLGEHTHERQSSMMFVLIGASRKSRPSRSVLAECVPAVWWFEFLLKLLIFNGFISIGNYVDLGCVRASEYARRLSFGFPNG